MGLGCNTLMKLLSGMCWVLVLIPSVAKIENNLYYI